MIDPIINPIIAKYVLTLYLFNKYNNIFASNINPITTPIPKGIRIDKLKNK